MYIYLYILYVCAYVQYHIAVHMYITICINTYVLPYMSIRNFALCLHTMCLYVCVCGVYSSEGQAGTYVMLFGVFL